MGKGGKTPTKQAQSPQTKAKDLPRQQQQQQQEANVKPKAAKKKKNKASSSSSSSPSQRSSGSGFSFVRLVVGSVVYPTLLALALAIGWVAYIQFVYGTQVPTADLSRYNANISVRLDGLTFTSVATNGVRLNVIEAGNRSSSKLAVLLHGFPETALLSWHQQIPALVKAGYFVVAPDQRGYNQSDKPQDVQSYWIDSLTGDVKGLLDHYNYKKAVIIGHDWGAAVAWSFAQKYSESTEKLVVMNAPHAGAYLEHVRSSLSQLRKSWYFFYFQVPYLPEMKLASHNYSTLRDILEQSGVAGKTFSLDSLPRYLQAWSEPGALSGMINWYRAMIRNAGKPRGDTTIRVPTQIIWGKKDVALDEELAVKSLSFCDRGMCKLKVIDEATHWVHHEEPKKVAKIITSFLKN